ncbi:MAG: hypothetical protein Q7N87_01930 [Candidatus Uhrbacteria bacterium]|nr:hypothetical protein [Candidatus Uhrbacteria bacterium]
MTNVQPKTISQGLRRVKQLKGQMAEFGSRAAACVSYEESQKPVWAFGETREKLRTTREQLVTLEAAIARANATATVEIDGKRMTIAEAVRRLQETKAEIVWLQGLRLTEGVEKRRESEYDEATGRSVPRVTEVVHKTELKEVDRVADVERLRNYFDRLNDAVETANHMTKIEWEVATA